MPDGEPALATRPHENVTAAIGVRRGGDKERVDRLDEQSAANVVADDFLVAPPIDRPRLDDAAVRPVVIVAIDLDFARLCGRRSCEAEQGRHSEYCRCDCAIHAMPPR